tara:strand:- start:713 stop:1330 length:618 start_codon:yes stop_codon:yes gene_type:complete
MLRVEIAGNTYDLPTEYKEITIAEYLDVYRVLMKYENIDENDEIGHLQMYADLFKLFTGVDDKTLAAIPFDDVTATINSLQGIMKEHEPEGISSFLCEGERYHFPQMRLKGETFGAYIEATQLDLQVNLLKHGKLDVIPEQMAILCRRTGEAFDDEYVQERTEKFKHLTMDILWEYAFFLSRQTANLERATQWCLASLQKKKMLV